MAFLVQDDNGTVSGAVSYITVAEFRAYHLVRGNDVSIYTDVKCEIALAKATDYMDGRFGFIGIRVTSEQRTKWPRADAIDQDDRLRSGIPSEVKEACAEYALIALTSDLNPAPTRDATGRAIQSKRTVVGPIEKSIVYAGQASFQSPKYPVADARLRPLLSGGGLEFELS